jgi:hypothetical protein
MVKAGVPAVKEPVGLSRADGMSLILRYSGKSVVRDETVVNTMAESCIVTSSQTAAGAAEIAHRRKTDKYFCLQATGSSQS